ncbi:MAG TPA: LEA type 2 family protein [Gemmatimonadaceae bacterium]|nr:LEA type 2 family protein [Gemmatimonadaceae bacterium]
MKRVLSAMVISAALMGAAACGPIGRSSFLNPVVELKDVRLRGIGFDGGSLDVVLNVYNPNDYRLDASKVTYRLFVDTAQIATGEVNQRVTLDNKKKTEVTLPVSFTNRELFGAAAVLTKTGSVDYRVAGDVTVATPFGNFTRPYEGRGRFNSVRP